MSSFKRLILIIVLMILVGVMTGCGDNKKMVELENAIGDLQSFVNDFKDEKDILLDEIESLTAQIEELEKDKGTQQSIIYALRSSLEEANNKLKALEEKISSVATEIKVQLADSYSLVVGDNFQLFYRSIIQAPNPYGYYIKIEGTRGHIFNRYYEYNPTDADAGKSFNLKVSVCDANGVEFGSDETILYVSKSKIDSSKHVTKNILCIGDSLTSNGVWVGQGIKRYNEAGYTKINTLGTISKTVNGTTVNYEGRGSWSWANYLEGITLDGVYTDTPFRSKTNSSKISFKEYANNLGYSKIDELYILLTWNGVGGTMREYSFNDWLFSNAKKLIDTFHTEFPSGKVTLIAIPKPSTNAGLGAYYQVSKDNYGDNYGVSVSVMRYNQFMEDWCNMAGYSSFMRYVDGMGQFDSEYNMPSESKPVNNQSTVKESIGNAMGIHPNNNGYMQIGDIFFRALMKEWK